MIGHELINCLEVQPLHSATAWWATYRLAAVLANAGNCWQLLATAGYCWANTGQPGGSHSPYWHVSEVPARR